jgi:hypothetical protein
MPTAVVLLSLLPNTAVLGSKLNRTQGRPDGILEGLLAAA